MKLYYNNPESLSAAISGERRGIVNREILFRGKDAIYHEWIYGDLLTYASHTQIWQDSDFGKFPASVIPETIGQFTGLTDIHGVKIFEGDIIKQYEKTQFGDPVSDFGLVKWDNKECMLFRTSTRIGKDRLVTSHDTYEVIGNIYDNPGLRGVNDNG